MAVGEKAQLYKDRAKTIPASYKTKAEYVILSDGNNLEEVLRDDLVASQVNHEETNFKVGQGDVDVSTSVVDGEASKMVIKGKSYQNILPDPSLRNSMTDGKSMQKFNEGYDDVNVVDGVAKSAILRGQTLVNLQPKAQRESWGVKLNGDMPLNNAYGGFDEVLPKLKPSTKYLIKFSKNISDKYNTAYFSQATVTIGNIVNDYRIVTTLDSLTANTTAIHIYPKDNAFSTVSEMIDYLSDLHVMIIEYQNGMENWDIPYFEGMQSVRMPVLHSVGKNLFNINGEINEKFSNVIANNAPNTVDGNTIIASSWTGNHHGKGQKIKVKRGKLYTCSFTTSDNGNVIIHTPNKVNFTSVKSSTFTFTAPTDCDEIVVAFNTYGASSGGKIHNLCVVEGDATSVEYEPYKSNILTVNEEVELGSVGDVKDELNLLTGELTQRTREVAYSNDMKISLYTPKENSFYLIFGDKLTSAERLIIADKIPHTSNWGSFINNPNLSCYSLANTYLYITIPSVGTVDEAKQYLSNLNPIFRYVLATESVKTVDLSSYGNWEKVVLDGSDDEKWKMWNDYVGQQYGFFGAYLDNTVLYDISSGSDNRLISNDMKVSNTQLGLPTREEGIATRQVGDINRIYLSVSKQKATSVDELRTYLQQNPMTVWYKTATSQDNSISEMLSFNDGHIQVSSEEGSLLPSVEYEVPTSNSYHMDLMKPSTKYTMKNMSGTFNLNGVNGNLSSNGTFTTPSNIGNKFMTVSTSQTNAMLLEGDVVDKTLPYFKGIKSAFENEDKIEVLSTGKNLFDKNTIPQMGVEYKDFTKAYATTIEPILKLKPNTLYQISGEVTQIPNRNSIFKFVDNNGVEIQGTYVSMNNTNGNEPKTIVIKNKFTTGNNGEIYFNTFPAYTQEDLDKLKDILNSSKIQIEESSTQTSYESYKSNSTKIPLLQGLKSTPTGDVYDEVIVERHNNVATVTKRINDDLSVMATPITTKVDMSGFPYIYKDGHIFLNTEIAPKVELTYNTCQSHQIQANNESLQRHEKEISELDEYIAYFIESDYRLKLLKFDMEMTSIMGEK